MVLQNYKEQYWHWNGAWKRRFEQVLRESGQFHLLAEEERGHKHLQELLWVIWLFLQVLCQIVFALPIGTPTCNPVINCIGLFSLPVSLTCSKPAVPYTVFIEILKVHKRVLTIAKSPFIKQRHLRQSAFWCKKSLLIVKSTCLTVCPNQWVHTVHEHRLEWGKQRWMGL